MKRRALIATTASLIPACVLNRPGLVRQPRGLWRDVDGYVAIGSFPEFGPGPFLFDYQTPQMVALRPVDRSRWQVCRSLAPAKSANDADGSGDLIEFHHEALQWGSRLLMPVQIRRRQIDAYNGGVELRGELTRPQSSKLRGTVLMVYGSGPATREAFDPWAFWFLSQGFAVVTADKRGCGQSGGDWRLTGLSDLAADARSILGAASAPRPFYGWGASQAGWILPQLGAKGLIDAILLQAGAATTPARQILANVDAELRAYGFPQSDIDDALGYYAIDVDVARGLRPFEDIDSAYRRAISNGAEWILAPPASADAPERQMIRLMADFDPAPFWRASLVPVLALFGGKDWVVPAEENVSALRQAVSPAVDLTTTVLPRANHLMFDSETGVRSEYPSRSRIVDGYFEGMSAWLARRS